MLRDRYRQLLGDSSAVPPSLQDLKSGMIPIQDYHPHLVWKFSREDECQSVFIIGWFVIWLQEVLA